MNFAVCSLACCMIIAHLFLIIFNKWLCSHILRAVFICLSVSFLCSKPGYYAWSIYAYKPCDMSFAKTLLAKFEVNTTNLQHRVISIVTNLRINWNLLFNGDISSTILLRDSILFNKSCLTAFIPQIVMAGKCKPW